MRPRVPTLALLLAACGAPASVREVALWRVTGEDGWERLTLAMPAGTPGAPAFRALAAEDHWPAGLAPVFAIERAGRQELRRRPPRGQEQLLEPLFFGLPPADEPDTAALTGRWTLRATRTDGSPVFTGWDLACETNAVSGRFDPLTDYRFAFLTGGVFVSNRLVLHAEYIREAYEITGELEAGRLAGAWTQRPDGDHGTWEATRDAVPALPAALAVPLRVWRRNADGARRFGLGAPAPGPGWTADARPLCLVWPPAEPSP